MLGTALGPTGVYDQATNCGNMNDCNNIVNHTENHYNMAEDPLREFSMLEDALILFSSLTCAVP
jgi:hypothetical protein